MQACQPDIVIHMAAQPLVRLSYDEPVETYATNVMGTVHVLEAARQAASVKSIVVVTTDKCYDNKEWAWGYREIEPMGGHDPYSNSKGCAELVTSAYRSSFLQGQGKAVATARAGNVIGGGDWAADRLVPDILRAFEQHQPVLIRNPHATRPWQHVLEPLSGYLTLAEQLYTQGQAFAEGWNFGPKDDDALGSWSTWPKPGARAPVGSKMAARTHTRPITSSSTSPKPRPAWAGNHAGRWPRHSNTSAAGTRPGWRMTTCTSFVWPKYSNTPQRLIQLQHDHRNHSIHRQTP
jgi:CDP-glucose 4,6-dehydratase